MSYIGNEPRFTQFPSKFFNGDGSTQTVTLDYAPPNKAAILVFISGVRQDTDAYTLSGTSLTFTGAVPSGTNNVQVVHLGLTVQVPTPADGTVTNAKLADMAANTVKVRDANSSGVPSDKAVATTEILIGDGTGFTAAALSSDVTMTNAGAVTIAADAVTYAKMQDTSTNNRLLGAATAGTIAEVQVATDMVADNAVTLAKMAGLVRGKIIYGDASGDPAALTVGTNGQALVSDGTDISWGSAGASDVNGLSDCLVENSSYFIGSDPNSTTSGAYYNVSVGSGACAAITTGDNNVVIGHNAAPTLTTASENVLIGEDVALTLTTGGYNVCIGRLSGPSVTAGASAEQNICIGKLSGTDLTTGFNNTLVGMETGMEITEGDSNTALGHRAMKANVDGDDNVCIGWKSGDTFQTGVTGNTMVGMNSGQSHTTGIQNTMIGMNASGNSGTTTYTTSLGGSCLDNISSGDNSTGLGNNAQNSSSSASNCFTLGNSSVDDLRCNDTSISGLSDERDKSRIEDLPEDSGLDFINQLKPRTFFWDRREWYEDGTPDGSKIKENYRKWQSNSGQRMGFIAQEVQSAIDGKKCMEDARMVSESTAVTEAGVVEKLEFAPGQLITPLVKAIQQLSAEVESLKAQLEGQ